MISLVQTANTLPTFLLAMPAGAAADLMDRRNMLLFTQSWMLAAAAILGVITVAGLTGPWTLLALTFLLGLGAAANAPAWSATIPELVPQEQMASAVTLHSIQFNVARAVGPALAGIVLAAAGAGVAFLLNALSFVAVLAAIATWREQKETQSAGLAEIRRSMLEGFNFVRASRGLRRLFVLLAAFVTSSAALWALLPVYARQQTHATEAQFGLMLSSLGAGAVLAGIWLSGNRHRWKMERLLALGMGVFGAATFGLSRIHSPNAAFLCLLPGGFAWITIMSSFNVAAQTELVSEVRARGLSFYLLVFQGSMALGGWLWGSVTSRFGLNVAFTLSAILLGLVTTHLLVIASYQKNR